MVRRAPDPCIICEQLKCSCGRPAKPEKAPRKRAPRKTPAAPAVPPPTTADAPSPEPVQQVQPAPLERHPLDSTVTQKASARAAMKARAARSRAAQPVRPEGDRVTEDAIRSLSDLLHPDERSKHAAVLAKPSSTHARAMAWRQRRVNAQ